MRPGTRKWSLNLLRLLVTGAAILLVLRNIRLEDLVRILAGVDRLLFTAMLAAALVPLLFLGMRWWLLLRANAFQVPLPRALLLSYAGAFFNGFLAGAVGGDVAKLLLIAPGEARKTALVATVILDRVVGLTVLIAVASGCLAPFLGRLPDDSLGWVVWSGIALLVLTCAVFFVPLLRSLPASLPFRATLLQVYEVFLSLRERKRLLAGVVGCSLAAQLGIVAIVFGLSRAMGMQSAQPWMFLAFVPLALLAAGLPISVGGWGVQEYVYAELFGSLGGVDSSQAVALSVIYKLSQLLVCVPGGLLYGLGALERREPGCSSPSRSRTRE